MIDAKDFLPRSFRIDRLVTSAAISAVLGAACCLPMAANAQSTPVSPATPDASAPLPTLAPLPAADTEPLSPPPAVDYSILANQSFNYQQIIRARSYGLTDDEIGRAIVIADRADVPTSVILDEVRGGWTFTKIAEFWGVRPELHQGGLGDRVEDYITAYQATGKGALEAAASDSGSFVSTNGSMSGGMPASMGQQDIIQTLRSSDDFHTLTHALRRAGLDTTLEGAGPFTVFAPTDEAFAKLTKEQMRSLMRNKAELTQVLEYHVIPANISAASAEAMTSPASPATLEGDSLQVTTANAQLMINDATVTTPDIQASNGVIHAIDTVLLPPSVAAAWSNSGPQTIDEPVPGTATAPGADSKTPTPNAIGGTAPNATPPVVNAPNGTPAPTSSMDNGAQNAMPNSGVTPGTNGTPDSAPGSVLPGGTSIPTITPQSTTTPNIDTTVPQTTPGSTDNAAPGTLNNATPGSTDNGAPGAGAQTTAPMTTTTPDNGASNNGTVPAPAGVPSTSGSTSTGSGPSAPSVGSGSAGTTGAGETSAPSVGSGSAGQ